MRVIFLDIDGVLVNRRSLQKASGSNSKADPSCVAVLNRITDATGAKIVISSTWRHMGLDAVTKYLREWGVTGEVQDAIPDLKKSINIGKDLELYMATTRGKEIKAWLEVQSMLGDMSKDDAVEAFCILDDDDDMEDLRPSLIQTEFEDGLLDGHAERAILMLSGL